MNIFSRNPLLATLGVLTMSSTLVACGKGDDVKMTPLAPGSECLQGGVELTVNGTSYLACSGQDAPVIKGETFAFGEGENPCDGNGVRFTILQKAKDPVIAWSCDATNVYATETARVAREAILGELRIITAGMTNSLECAIASDEPPSEGEIQMYSLQIRMLESVEICTANLFNRLPEASDAAIAVLDCQVSAGNALLQCYNDLTADGAYCPDDEVTEAPCDAEEDAAEACTLDLAPAVDSELDSLLDMTQMLMRTCGIPL